MELRSKYQQLLSRIALTLKYHSYKKRNSNFYIQKNGNWGIINFQKSTKSSSTQIIFTVNLGVASTRLLNFFSVIYSKKGPNIWDCHWRRRLGQLSEGEDVWWSIDIGTSIEELSEYILSQIVSYAIPEIGKYLDDNELRDLWLSGHSPSLTEFQRLMNLSVLLKEMGPHELLEPILRKMKQISIGKPTSFTTDIHLRMLNRK
jgi:hypothetical protein